MDPARQTRTNNLDALRLYAAILVIYGHGFMLAGLGPAGLWNVPLARIGVDIFFSISGYLVTKSWNSAPAVSTYFGKRALRIMPGLIACVLVSVFIIGPLASDMNLRSYFSARQTYAYLANIGLYLQFTLPGVFTGMRGGGTVNGSLWSLFPEVLCYCTVPAFAHLPMRQRLWALPIGGFISGGIGVALFQPNAPGLSIYHLDLKYMLVEVPFFFIGGWLALLEPRFKNLYRADLALLALVANYSVSSWFGFWNLPVEWISFPYVIITFGRMSLTLINRAAIAGDLSYGLYLYGFPIQQLILRFAPKLAHPVLSCILLTFPAAFLSWHLVEKNARGLRSRLPSLRISSAARRQASSSG